MRTKVEISYVKAVLNNWGFNTHWANDYDPCSTITVLTTGMTPDQFSKAESLLDGLGYRFDLSTITQGWAVVERAPN